MSFPWLPGMTLLKVTWSSAPGVVLTKPHLLRPSSAQLTIGALCTIFAPYIFRGSTSHMLTLIIPAQCQPLSGSAMRRKPSPIMHLEWTIYMNSQWIIRFVNIWVLYFPSQLPTSLRAPFQQNIPLGGQMPRPPAQNPVHPPFHSHPPCLSRMVSQLLRIIGAGSG